ncbi:MAG TPA: VWA domain-containing protein [Candidatus Angelobacter sp.]|nr:VWA domain-containing protein [Candidatus Angelobacter sp.]
MKPAAAAIATLCLAPFIVLTSQEKKAADQPQAQPNAPYTFSIGANMVLVPVVVSDKHGQHVTGLTANDFELREDGKEQKIAGFEEINAEKTAVQRVVVAPNSFTNQVAAAHPKKLEIILLDLLNTPVSGRVEARRGLAQFLSQSTEPDTLLALLVLRGDGVQIIHNFTSDPSVLVAAVKKAQAPAAALDSPALNTNGGDVDAEARQIHAIVTGQNAAATVGGSANPTGALVAMERGQEALTDKSRQDADALLTLRGLQQIARYFAAVPGRKSLIWASTGFRFNLGSMAGEATRGTTVNDWQRTARMLQDANIAVYPVDVGGLPPAVASAEVHGEIPTAGDAIASGMIADPSTGKHQTMEQLAGMTGGQAFYNLNNSDEFFRRASQDSEQYYMLAYYTTNTAAPGWRKLSVRVHHDNVRLRTRSGFFFNNAARDPESTRQSDEFSALTSALESTSLPIKGEWTQTEVSGNQRKVHFALTLPPGAVLLDREHENRVSVDFLIYVWNAEGKEEEKIGQRLERPLTADEISELQTKGLSYENVFTLPPGKYDVHFVVRDNLRGKLGSVVTQLTVE